MMHKVRILEEHITQTNISCVTEGVRWVRLRRPREKNTIEKWYYVLISIGCQNIS